MNAKKKKEHEHRTQLDAKEKKVHKKMDTCTTKESKKPHVASSVVIEEIEHFSFTGSYCKSTRLDFRVCTTLRRM